MLAQRIPISVGQSGVLKVIKADDRNYYIVDDVMQLLGVSRPKAYRVIRALRDELIAAGKLIPEYPAGRIPKKYCDARCGND